MSWVQLLVPIQPTWRVVVTRCYQPKPQLRGKWWMGLFWEDMRELQRRINSSRGLYHLENPNSLSSWRDSVPTGDGVGESLFFKNQCQPSRTQAYWGRSKGIHFCCPTYEWPLKGQFRSHHCHQGIQHIIWWIRKQPSRDMLQCKCTPDLVVVVSKKLDSLKWSGSGIEDN